MSEATGRRECELKSELCEELREWEAEVKAMSKMLGSVVAPKKKEAAGKKKGADAVVEVTVEVKKEEPETEKATEEPEAQKAVAVAPKKKAAAKKKATEEPEAEKATEEPEAQKAAPKKKAAAAKKKATEEPEAEKSAPKKKAAAKKKKEEPEAEKAPEVEWNVKVVVTTEEEEEEVEVEEMEYNGVKYLKSSRGVVYDIETSEEVGVWNEETKSIESD